MMAMAATGKIDDRLVEWLHDLWAAVKSRVAKNCMVYWSDFSFKW